MREAFWLQRRLYNLRCGPLAGLDNGSGMPHEQIPDMLGKVLSGTKYGVGQTRGKFGLGAKMALIWSKMTTGMPFNIYSARQGQSFRSHYSLDINIHKNAPNIHLCEKLGNEAHWHGTKLSVVIEGSWQHYRSYVLRYLRQIAVITPYAQFSFSFGAIEPKNCMSMLFRRRSDAMPVPPKQVKHHPSSVDLELVKRLLHDTKMPSLRAFLSKEFNCISPDYASRLIQEMQDDCGEGTRPQDLSDKQATKLHAIMHAARFADPDGGHLSPAGEYNLRLGVIKELNPDLIATHQGDVKIFEGHAVIVEAAVSLGGRNIKAGLNIHRFANRIPLLFEGGSDVVTRTATKRIAWPAYKIQHTQDKVGVFVSIVSTKIPFKGAGKEYIGDDIEEMANAVKHAIQMCCVQLKCKIAKRQAAQEQKERKRNLTKYIPNAAAAVFSVLQDMAEHEAGPKRRKLQQSRDLLADLASGKLTTQSLEQALVQHVDSIDAEMALEYQMQTGLKSGATKDIHLAPMSSAHRLGPELHSAGAVIKLLL